MLKLLQILGRSSRRNFSLSTQAKFKVTIAGGAGSIGNALALQLKQCPYVTHLCLCDIVRTKGLAVDLSHINTASEVTGYKSPRELHCALEDADIIVMVAGISKLPRFSKSDLFTMNANLVRDLTKAASAVAPSGFIVVVTDPINSLVPVVCETLAQCNNPKPGKVFGFTTMHSIRAKNYVADLLGLDARKMCISIVGGSSSKTVVPLLSQISPASVKLTVEEIKKLTEKIRKGAVSKPGPRPKPDAMYMSYSIKRFLRALLRALNGESDVVETSYVKSDVTEAGYSANSLLLGKNGVEKNLGIMGLSCYEADLLDAVIPILKRDVKKGIDFCTVKSINR